MIGGNSEGNRPAILQSTRTALYGIPSSVALIACIDINALLIVPLTHIFILKAPIKNQKARLRA